MCSFLNILFMLFVLSAKQEIPDSAFCAMLQIPERIPLWELSTCLFFAVPMAVMVVLYGRMGMQIRSRTQRTLELGRLHMIVEVPQSHMFNEHCSYTLLTFLERVFTLECRKSSFF